MSYLKKLHGTRVCCGTLVEKYCRLERSSEPNYKDKILSGMSGKGLSSLRYQLHQACRRQMSDEKCLLLIWKTLIIILFLLHGGRPKMTSRNFGKNLTPSPIATRFSNKPLVLSSQNPRHPSPLRL